MKKIISSVKISGKALISTIATMETLGVIGEEVLHEHEIYNVEEDKEYPSEIRNAIHKAVFDRYGEVALQMMGFKNAEALKDAPLVKPVLDMAIALENDLSSDNKERHQNALTKIVEQYTKGADYQVKLFTLGGTADYGVQLKPLGQTLWEIKVTMAMPKFAGAFSIGVFDYVFTRAIGKYFLLSCDYKEKKTQSGSDYTTWFWNLAFTRQEASIPPHEVFMNRSNELRDSLMRAVLNDATDKRKKMEKASNEISKYIPPQIHGAIFSGKYDTRITTRRKKLTIFFSDIANFTSTSEGLQPEDLTKYLNEYFSEMTTIALDCGATIDKYIGDAMMVFFGDPESKGEKKDARACVEMALKMQEQMKELQEKWRNEGFADPFQVRMGINTGYCNVGNFGSEQRLTYTIIGGEVNVTQRLEGNADANGILMSYETYAHAQDMIEVEEREAIKMKGISREIKVFSVIERKRNAGNNKNEIKKKPTKKELSEIEKLKKDIAVMKNNIKDINKNMEKLLQKL